MAFLAFGSLCVWGVPLVFIKGGRWTPIPGYWTICLLFNRTTVGPLVLGVGGNIALGQPSRDQAIASFMNAYRNGHVRIMA